METSHIDAVQNDSAANINTNMTALQIIFTFTSYISQKNLKSLMD
jgi:hypothetical protein